jgi:tight adherence protein B
MIALAVIAFAVGTMVSWMILHLVANQRTIDRRLKVHGGRSIAVPTSSGDPAPLVESVRRVAKSAVAKPRIAGTRGGFLAHFRRKKRLEAFTKQIVDALTLISSSLKAGYSFIQSMEVVAQEVPAPLGEEFSLAMHEMSLGATVEESLEEMVQRVGSDDLALVVTAVLVQRQTGGNLAEVLDNIAETIRERIRIRGEIRTLTAQGRISGWIVGLLPVGLGAAVSAINPSYMSVLFRHPLGLLFLLLGACGQVIGVLVIRKIVQIEV